MDFHIDTAEALNITDIEISNLLSQVYVGGGFIDSESAISYFEASKIRARGKLICAREVQSRQLVGMVIVVFFDSKARRFAQKNETEMHLLGVKSGFRKNGLGKRLIHAALKEAKKSSSSKMLLWTQTTMHTAHRLYDSFGFTRVPSMDFAGNNQDFFVYEKILHA